MTFWTSRSKSFTKSTSALKVSDETTELRVSMLNSVFFITDIFKLFVDTKLHRPCANNGYKQKIFT